MIFTKKNRFTFFATLLLMLSSFNAFAILEATCVLAGATVPQGPGYAVDLYPNQWVTFWWEDSENLDIKHVKFTYEDPTIPNDDKYFMWDNHYQDPYQQTHNYKSWYVPTHLSGKYIYITISDLNNDANKYTFACQIASPKTQQPSFQVQSPEITCFPNPIINFLNVQAGNEALNSINIYDIKGNMILRQEFHQSSQETIDVSTLPKGTYVAIINEEKQFKIVKQ